MFAKLLTGVALTGAVALGPVGVASAATTSTPTPAHQVNCTRAEARLSALETKVSTWLPKAQAREAAASAKGRTQRAKNIANRISKVQAFETKVEGKVAAACPGGSTSGPTATS